MIILGFRVSTTHKLGRDTIQSTEVAWPCDGTVHVNEAWIPQHDEC